MRAVQLPLTVILLLSVLFTPALAAAHPLDPLTPDEIRAATRIARTDARFAGAQFASTLLDEPAKADVIRWKPGTRLPRRARLVVMTPASVFELVVDLPASRLVSAIERHLAFLQAAPAQFLQSQSLHRSAHRWRRPVAAWRATDLQPSAAHVR
jgi:Cu2+-containing amine oxidase